MTVKPDGSGLKQLGDHCAQAPPKCVDDSDPGWSPNGKQIVFTRATGKIRPAGGTFTEDQIEHSALMIENADGTHPRKVVELPPYVADLHYPIWSPDGQMIVFVVRHSESAKPPLGQAVFSVRIDGSRLKRLTPWGPRFGDGGDVSPDGKLMVFRTEPDEHGSGGQIYLMHSDGTHRKALTHGDDSVRLFSSTFSPDGKSVVFGRATDGEPDLVSVGVDGSNEHAVTHTTSWESAPDWGSPASG